MKYLSILLLFASAIFVIGCNTNADEVDQTQTIPVRLVSVQQKQISIPIQRSGLLFAKNEARLSFKIGGYIQAIYADEGQHVKKGALLSSLDLSEIEAQVIQAQSAYDKALRDLKRLENLFQDSVATLEQKQDASTGFHIAEATLEIARFNRRHAQIFAPSDGVILKRFVEQNELIAPGTPIFYFAPKGQNWILRLGVSDSELLQLQIGDSAQIYFDGYPEQSFSASISELARGADMQSGTFEVELTLEKNQLPLVTGFVGEARIYPSIYYQSFIIPVESLIEANGDVGYVYRWESGDQSITKTPVKIFALLDGSVAVSGGLEGVEQIIGKGSAYITERTKIKIIE